MEVNEFIQTVRTALDDGAQSISPEQLKAYLRQAVDICEQYRAIGTVEECAAMKKKKALKKQGWSAQTFSTSNPKQKLESYHGKVGAYSIVLGEKSGEPNTIGYYLNDGLYVVYINDRNGKTIIQGREKNETEAAKKLLPFVMSREATAKIMEER